MKHLLIILTALSLIAAGCQKDPIASALVGPNPAYVGDVITFESRSTNTDYVEWEMGDGFTYSEPYVEHYYDDPGVYDVKLKAFGTKGGVNVAVIPVEVIGATLTIDVRVWTEDWDTPDYNGYYVPGARVRLYPTAADWDAETNLIEELYTDSNGRCVFSNLSYKEYYADIWEAYHDNYTLRDEDIYWVTSPFMNNDYIWEAPVDYYPGGKKSTATGDRSERTRETVSSGQKRTLSGKKTAVPREKK